MRNKCEEHKRIYLSAPHLAHVPEATRSYPAANSPQNLRVRDMLPALSELDMFTGWKAGKLLTGAQAAGEPRDSSETHSTCSLHHPDEPSPSHSYVWANKVCRNLSQRRLTTSQGKQHLHILAGLVKAVPALPVGFPSLFYSSERTAEGDAEQWYLKDNPNKEMPESLWNSTSPQQGNMQDRLFPGP